MAFPFSVLYNTYIWPLLQITVKAGKDIAEGEHIATMYTHALWGTIARYTALHTLVAAIVAARIKTGEQKHSSSPQTV